MSRHVAPPRLAVQDQQPGSDRVSVWVAEGIISEEQAQRIRAREGLALGALAAPGRASKMPLVIEALGYLGGAIVVVATMMIGGRYWSDLGDVARLGLLGGAALLLLAGGWLLPASLGDLGSRLRSVVWLVSTGAVVGFLAVWGSQVADLHGSDLALVITGGAAAYAVVLFVARPAFLQQAAMMGLLGGTLTALLAKVVGGDSWPAVGVWAAGVAWFALAEMGVLRPTGMARAAGAALAVIGAMVSSFAGADPAIAFSLVTVASVVVLAVVLSDLVLLAIGSLGAIQAIITAANQWFPDSVVGAVALLVAGGGLVGTAIWIARRRGRGTEAGAVR